MQKVDTLRKVVELAKKEVMKKYGVEEVELVEIIHKKEYVESGIKEVRVRVEAELQFMIPRRFVTCVVGVVGRVVSGSFVVDEARVTFHD